MNKFIKGMLCIVGMCTLFLVECSNDASKGEVQTNRQEEVVTSKEEIENIADESNDDTNKYSKKQTYLQKLNQLEVDLNTLLKEKYDSGVTQQMVEASSEEFKKWDDVLNEVYSELKIQLTKEEMNKLTEEQLNWIKSRDEKSEAADDGVEDGTIAPLNRVMSLVTSTKERCYELVNQYME